MPRTAATIADTVLALLRERGPQDVDTLVPAILEAGLTRAKDPRTAVAQAIANRGWDFLTSWDGHVCSIVDQLEGAIFTHRTTALERRNGIVVLSPDLVLVERLAVRGRPLARGGEAHLHFVADFFELPDPYQEMDEDERWDELGEDLRDELTGFVRELGAPYEVADADAVLAYLEANRYSRLLDGPPGWLPTIVGDQLLALGIRDGMIEPLIADRRSIHGPHVGIVAAQVARLARLVIGPDPSWFGPPVMSIETLLELVATESPELFRRPLPPFNEVVARGGLEIVDGLVGHRGTDWDALAREVADPSEAWGFRPSRSVVH